MGKDYRDDNTCPACRNGCWSKHWSYAVPLLCIRRPV